MQISMTFDSVKRKCSKRGKCKCGKTLTRSTTFEQTLNPYNKNQYGVPKSRGEILAELQQSSNCWQPNFTCNKCSEA